MYSSSRIFFFFFFWHGLSKLILLCYYNWFLYFKVWLSYQNGKERWKTKRSHVILCILCADMPRGAQEKMSRRKCCFCWVYQKVCSEVEGEWMVRLCYGFLLNTGFRVVGWLLFFVTNCLWGFLFFIFIFFLDEFSVWSK